MTPPPVPGNRTCPGPPLVPNPQGEQSGVQALAPGETPASLLLERVCSCRALYPSPGMPELGLSQASPRCRAMPRCPSFAWGGFHFPASAPEISLVAKYIFVLFTDSIGCFGSAVNPFEYMKKTALIIHQSSFCINNWKATFPLLVFVYASFFIPFNLAGMSLTAVIFLMWMVSFGLVHL